jgi:hypothetical protein
VALPAAVAGDAMTNSIDAAQLLDGDMDQLAGAFALVAKDWQPGVERRYPFEAASAQHGADRGQRPAHMAGNRRAAHSLTAQGLDLRSASLLSLVGLQRGRGERSARLAAPSAAKRSRHFCVLRVKARGQRDLIVLTGHAAVISTGEFISAMGVWVNDREHGLLFKATHVTTT